MFNIPQRYQSFDFNTFTGFEEEQEAIRMALASGQSVILHSQRPGTGKTSLATHYSPTQLDRGDGSAYVVQPAFVKMLDIPSPASYSPADKDWWTQMNKILDSGIPTRIIIDNVQVEGGAYAETIHQNFRHFFHKVYDSGKQYIMTTTMNPKDFAPIVGADVASRLCEATFIDLDAADFRRTV